MNSVINQNKDAYLRLRKAVGILGMTLPVVLLVGGGIFDGVWGQSSISEYHYSAMRDYFGATLGTIGLFLFYYPGYDRWDRVASWLSSVGAWGVVIIYTTADPLVPCTEQCSLHRDIHFFNTLLAGNNRANVHLVFATMFFLGITLFCFLFRKSSNRSITEFIRNMARFDWVRWMIFPGFGLNGYDAKERPRKRFKNLMFLICGWGMVISIVAIAALHHWLPLGQQYECHLFDWLSHYGTYSFESLGVFLFGAAWFFKGEGHHRICEFLRRPVGGA